MDDHPLDIALIKAYAENCPALVEMIYETKELERKIAEYDEPKKHQNLFGRIFADVKKNERKS